MPLLNEANQATQTAYNDASTAMANPTQPAVQPAVEPAVEPAGQSLVVEGATVDLNSPDLQDDKTTPTPPPDVPVGVDDPNVVPLPDAPEAEAQGTIGGGDPTLQDLYPEEREVTTVDAELARILGQDSPIMAQARSQAAMAANKRGLLNTSIAAGMGQAAMVERGLPMAQQNADAQNRADSERLAQITQLNQQFLHGSQAMDLATIQGTYEQLISTNEIAGNLYQSYFSGIADLMDNPDMTPAQIASGVDTMQRMLEASLRMISEMNAINFDDLSPLPVPTPPNTPVPQPGPEDDR